MREVGERIKSLDDEVKEVDGRIEALLSAANCRFLGALAETRTTT